MNWLTLSLRDWQRRPLRMFVTTAGVAIAIAALWSLLSFQQGYSAGVRNELNRLGAHVLVVPKGCPYDAASIALHGASWPCYLKEAYLSQVRAAIGVATAAPVFMTALYDKTGAQHVYAGVDSNIHALKSGWHVTGHFPEHDGDLLVGARVGQEMKWRVGQRVQLPGVPGRNGTISGILAPSQSADDAFIYMRLPDAQRIFEHPREITHILVRLQDPDELEKVVTQLRGCEAGLEMNIVPLSHLFQTIQTLVNSTRLLLGCIALVALLVAGAGVSNVMLMAVVERTREIGVMRALGASHRDIFGLFWLETMQVCLAGAATGVAVAFIASHAVEAWLRARLPFAPTDTMVNWHGWIVALCLACALVLGSIAGLLPAWRAARLSPIEAIRSSGGPV